jgi:hypothetical protein
MTGNRRFPLLARSATLWLLACALILFAGCSSQKTDLRQFALHWGEGKTTGLTFPAYNKDVDAIVCPPVGWKPDPLKSSPNHIHQVWLSPTTDTAYGVIHFKMPLPVGADIALTGFLAQMKKTEGDATLLELHDDPNLPGIRFVAHGGLYTIRANLIVRGWEGWAFYAGTQRGKPIDPIELDFATRAREHTRIGRPENSGN